MRLPLPSSTTASPCCGTLAPQNSHALRVGKSAGTRNPVGSGVLYVSAYTTRIHFMQGSFVWAGSGFVPAAGDYAWRTCGSGSGVGGVHGPTGTRPRLPLHRIWSCPGGLRAPPGGSSSVKTLT